jgi:hypothetical protein
MDLSQLIQGVFLVGVEPDGCGGHEPNVAQVCYIRKTSHCVHELCVDPGRPLT